MPKKGSSAKKKVLIVNNESKYMKDLKKLVEDHSKGKAETDTVHVKDASSKITPENIPYDAVILSGSYKRSYDDKHVQYVIETIDKHNDAHPNKQIPIYGACLGHQALVHYHKGKVVDLGKYEKGTKEIELKEGGKTKTHKHHRWGVTDTGSLESIAESTIEDSKGKQRKISEASRHPTRPYIATQGHPERKGHAQDLLYTFLNAVYGK